MTTKQIIKELLDLQNNYSFTFRAMVTSERISHCLNNPGEINIKEKRVREPLIEHVGHLPIIASFLYSHLENKDKVNLGRTLIMLSIHDIGETITGEILAYKKTVSDSNIEYQAALKVISKDLIPYFEEFEARESFDAKFASAVDCLAPLLHGILSPNLTLKRFKVYGFNSEKIEKKLIKIWEKVCLPLLRFI